jgi:hypothetical protein
MCYLLPNYDRWLDDPYQRDMDARVDVPDDDPLDEEPYATVYSVGRMVFEGSSDPYPKDLLLNHYCAEPNHEMQRWKWRD